MTYFKNVKSYEDLKNQYRDLLKANHPDNGGDVEVMKEINVQFDALFAVWKHRKEENAAETVNETADSVRNEFYTAYGWKGSNHSWDRSLKEVAKIVRAYVKEKYPTYKFSVRTSYASMCQELHVDLMESPIPVYKTFEELTRDDRNDILERMRFNHIFNLNSWTREEEDAAIKDAWENHNGNYKVLNDVTSAVIKDVDAFVKSYNYHDCDGMIDYFDVDFYYFGCDRDNGRSIKIVPRTARIKNRKNEAKTKSGKKTQAQKTSATENNNIEEKRSYTFRITEGIDTRDNSELWIVKIGETLTREEYISVNKKIRDLGGYYSKFKHGFIFRFEPSEKLKELAA